MTYLSRARTVLFGEHDRLTNRYILLGGVIPNSVFLYLTIGAELTGPAPVPFLTLLAGVFSLVVAASLYYDAADVAIATTVPLLIMLVLIVSLNDLRFIHAWVAMLALSMLLAGVAYRNNGVLTCMAIGFVPGFLWMFLWIWGDHPLGPQPVWYQIVIRKLAAASLGGAIIGAGSGGVGYAVGRLVYHVAGRVRRPSGIQST